MRCCAASLTIVVIRRRTQSGLWTRGPRKRHPEFDPPLLDRGHGSPDADANPRPSVPVLQQAVGGVVASSVLPLHGGLLPPQPRRP